MRFSLISLLGYAASIVVGQEDYTVFEIIAGPPAPWSLKSGAEVNTSQSFKLRIHLKNQNMDAFQEKVLQISTPGHPSYGQHMDLRSVNTMLAPAQDSFNLVRQWLADHGLASKATIDNDWMIVQGTIGDAQELLDAKYQLFENPETGNTAARTLAYSLPAALHDHVDIIAPTIKFPTMSEQRSTIVPEFSGAELKITAASVTAASSQIVDGLDLVACNSSITPDCLKALYKLDGFVPSAHDGNRIALAGFLEEYAQYDDFAEFISTYIDPSNKADNFSTVLINGGLNLQDNVSGPQSQGEADLDIQYGGGIAYPIPATYISTGGRPPETTTYEVDNEPYLEFLTYLLAQKTIPPTISISYGDAEWSVPQSYAITVCNLFAQVAARGVSVLVSSGDSGSGSNCSAVDPGGKLQYEPAFPASCPWVTAVGATRYVDPEVAVSFSGGGFSNYFKQPVYQALAVDYYLAKKANTTYNQYFNTKGRAYPDVAAQGVYFHVFVNGTDELISGTSASSPAFAGFIALLNSDRIAKKLPAFGFLNPFLYTLGELGGGFTDITGGKSSGCTQVAGSGFAAVQGWDPVTGLGTPLFNKLKAISTAYFL